MEGNPLVNARKIVRVSQDLPTRPKKSSAGYPLKAQAANQMAFAN
jgi:hypothetical protein